jgi:hypothetical protein
MHLASLAAFTGSSRLDRARPQRPVNETAIGCEHRAYPLGGGECSISRDVAHPAALRIPARVTKNGNSGRDKLAAGTRR